MVFVSWIQTGSWFQSSEAWKMTVLSPILLLNTLGTTNKPAVWGKSAVLPQNVFLAKSGSAFPKDSEVQMNSDLTF